jgi:hypothetical protein
VRIAVAVLASLVAVLSLGCSSSSSGSGNDASQTDAQVAQNPEDERVVIRRADFQINYRLEGISQNSGFIGLMSNPNLSFARAGGDESAKVSAGTTVGRAVVDEQIRDALEAGASTSTLDQAQLDQLERLQGPISTPVGGVLSLRAGLPIVRTPGVDVVVPLTPIQFLRYQSLRFNGRATIETVIGERQVACEAVWIEPTDLESTVSGFESSSELHCRLPRYVETAAGLRAQISLSSERYRDVVLVPNVFVGYDKATDGYFINVIEIRQTERVPVVVGVTDGVVRVITSKVPVGATLAPSSSE